MPRPEDQTANLNRCLFFITLLISYATPVLFRIQVATIHTHTYVCVIAIHVPYIRLYRLVSLRREFITDSRIFDVLLQLLFSLPFSLGCYSILLPSPSLLSDPISLSPMILLPGDASKVTGTRVSIACRHTYTCWTDLPLGHSSDTFTSVKRHAHMDMAQPFRRQITFVPRVSRR